MFFLYVLFSISTSNAYFENYPPFSFKEVKSPMSLKPIVDAATTEYKNGGIVVERNQTKDGVQLLIKDEKKVLIQKSNIQGYRNETLIPYQIYHFDIDKNGLLDFVVFSNWDGVGLAAFNDHVDIFLKMENEFYRRISYNSMKARIDDFVDIDKDGEYEIIITGLYQGRRHNYFTYNLYRLNSYKLKNADSKTTGFPKFIWMTNAPNDKDTLHLTKKERALHTAGKNKSISYETV